MMGKREWSKAVKSFRAPHMGGLPTSVAMPRPSGCTSPTAGPPKTWPRTPWLSQTSASSSPAKERLLHTPSARWTRIWITAWWDSKAGLWTLDTHWRGICGVLVAALGVPGEKSSWEVSKDKSNIGRVGGLHSFVPTWNKVFLEALEQMLGFF